MMPIPKLKWMLPVLVLAAGLRYWSTPPPPAPADREAAGKRDWPAVHGGPLENLIVEAHRPPPSSPPARDRHKAPPRKRLAARPAPVAPPALPAKAQTDAAGSAGSEPEADKAPLPSVEQAVARERERGAVEDPLSRRQQEQQEHPDWLLLRPDELSPYLSARIHRRWVGGERLWGDTGSRLGLRGRWQFRSGHWLFGAAEAGINLLDGASLLFSPGSLPPETRFGDTLFPRLHYLGYESPNLMLVYGKNWSSYYQVAAFTDRFATAGADAGGAFNAATDGGRTGTGRADNVLQLRTLIGFFPRAHVKPFNLNLQFQNGEPIPGINGFHYGPGMGVSAILQTQKDYTIGLAWNRARIPDAGNPLLADRGINGDAEALVIGSRWFDENWYVAGIWSRLKNHEFTDRQIYFDGRGIELAGEYRVSGNLWGMLGWNDLRPDKGQARAGRYRVRYTLLGLRYAFDGFRRMVYLEARLEDSRGSDGQPRSDSVSLGIRWDWP